MFNLMPLRMSRHASSLRCESKRASRLISRRGRCDNLCLLGNNQAVDNLGDSIDGDEPNGWSVNETVGETTWCLGLE
ncbi:MAG: hypothetical protein UW94_C0001G0086 [Parcubacteria group bacterium GW2011_GWA2_45_14]|nr:MAG: hypothetical protein UW94_C0001G0086 [Parcubacteria group bacterium GW2011_GWA2_45_14]